MKTHYIQTFALGGGVSERLISKNFISNLINNKDYETTSRNTSLS